MKPAPEPDPARRAFLRGGFLRPFAVFGKSPEEPPAPAPVDDAHAPMPWERPTPPSPATARPARSGRFAIAPERCLAHRGQGCSVCRERCPVPGAIAITQGRPLIDPAICDGCGRCVATCPAPVLAIRFVPGPAA